MTVRTLRMMAGFLAAGAAQAAQNLHCLINEIDLFLSGGLKFAFKMGEARS